MSKSEPYICFTIANFEEVHRKDPNALQRVESALAQMGAIPGEVDWPKRVFCVSITNRDLPIQAILETFAAFGYHAKSIDGPRD